MIQKTLTTVLAISALIISLPTFAGDDDFDMEFDDMSTDVTLPDTTSDYSFLSFDTNMAGAADAIGFAGAVNGNGDAVGQTSGLSRTINDLNADLVVGSCGGCASVSGTLSATLGATNQMISAAEGVDGPLRVEAASASQTAAWGDLTVYREGTLIDFNSGSPAVAEVGSDD